MIEMQEIFSTRLVRLTFLSFSLSLSLIAVWSGCSSNSTEQGKEDPSAKTTKTDKQPQIKPEIAEKKEEPAKPTPAELWQQQVAKVEGLLEDEKLDAAVEELQGFRSIYTAENAGPDAAPSTEEKEELSKLIGKVNSLKEERSAEQRIALMEDAKAAYEKQEYNAATDAINELLAISPTDEQREQATAMRVEIERILARQRQLKTYIRMLGSEDEHNVKAGGNALANEPEVALSMLLEAVKENENLTLVRNALALMRRMKRPDVALPAMVGVLAREDQKESWEDAVREISQMDEPGAGEPLLELVKNSDNPEQRAAALESLVAVVDPPAETQVALLPLVMKDGPELPQALRALHRSVRVHGTYDAAVGRNLDVQLTDEQAAQWKQLPARLEEIMASEPEKPAEGEAEKTEEEITSSAAYEAKVLAMATRRMQPEILPIKGIISFSKEMDEGLATAVLDGVWNATDYASQWRQPIAGPDDRCAIELDLGQMRTVVGVRIWNFNEPNATHRGWKEVDVFVSEKSRAFDPVSSGIIPMAPGVAETPEAVLPDYSTFIPVDFVRGRYVKLQAKSLWRADAYAGLAEIQVIGF